jgi:hypothetical protein
VAALWRVFHPSLPNMNILNSDDDDDKPLGVMFSKNKHTGLGGLGSRHASKGLNVKSPNNNVKSPNNNVKSPNNIKSPQNNSAIPQSANDNVALKANYAPYHPNSKASKMLGLNANTALNPINNSTIHNQTMNTKSKRLSLTNLSGYSVPSEKRRSFFVSLTKKVTASWKKQPVSIDSSKSSNPSTFDHESDSDAVSDAPSADAPPPTPTKDPHYNMYYFY